MINISIGRSMINRPIGRSMIDLAEIETENLMSQALFSPKIAQDPHNLLVYLLFLPFAGVVSLVGVLSKIDSSSGVADR